LISAGVSPQTPLEELTAPPEPLAGFKGAYFYETGGERKGGEGKERKGRKCRVPTPAFE